MQKIQTDKLYIVGLFIVSGEEYKNDDLVVLRRFLKWIVVENESDDFSVCFRDIKTGVKYFSYGNMVGDLYIDMNTLFSFNRFTNKQKLGKEEIALYLKQFKDDYNITKIKNRRITYEVLLKLIKELGDEATLIIDKVMQEYDEESPENMKRFLQDISDSLDLNEKKRTRKRWKEWSKIWRI